MFAALLHAESRIALNDQVGLCALLFRQKCHVPLFIVEGRL
ncbi:hypothetical protein AXX16_1301 [Serratia rubidaea]|nr:hypothetical protein AXX16_1301 [Serratia rubidaea]